MVAKSEMEDHKDPNLTIQTNIDDAFCSCFCKRKRQVKFADINEVLKQEETSNQPDEMLQSWNLLAVSKIKFDIRNEDHREIIFGIKNGLYAKRWEQLGF